MVPVEKDEPIGNIRGLIKKFSDSHRNKQYIIIDYFWHFICIMQGIFNLAHQSDLSRFTQHTKADDKFLILAGVVTTVHAYIGLRKVQSSEKNTVLLLFHS